MKHDWRGPVPGGKTECICGEQFPTLDEFNQHVAQRRAEEAAQMDQAQARRDSLVKAGYAGERRAAIQASIDWRIAEQARRDQQEKGGKSDG